MTVLSSLLPSTPDQDQYYYTIVEEEIIITKDKEEKIIPIIKKCNCPNMNAFNTF